MSKVIGLRLSDSREVVVKVRRAEHRVYACAKAQRHLWKAGYPCPEPLAGPTLFGDELATAEAYVSGGVELDPSLTAAELYGQSLADLVRLAPSPNQLPSLHPPPPWAWWDYPEPSFWAWQSEAELALAAERGWLRPEVPPELAWLEDVALRARARLRRFAGPPVVGHVDWYVGNLRWLNGKLHVVHDWDSLSSQPEAIICGLGMSTFAISLARWVPADLARSEAFLNGYDRVRGRPWSRDEREACWAAAVWKETYEISSSTGDVPARLELLESELDERLRLAGIFD